MKKTIAIALACIMTTAASAHDYGTNGICRDAGCTEPYEQPTLEDGCYLLSNAGHVEWLSGLVNAGGNARDLRAKMMSDIDFTGVTHTPIGNGEGCKFNGEFDGQGHRIMNLKLRTTADRQAFFGGLRGGGTVVRNLIMDKSCTIQGKQRVAGIVAFAQTAIDGPIIIENCINEATVSATSTGVGGILGGSLSPHPAIHIIGCINTGTVRGGGETASIVGWLGDNAGSLAENCYNTGRIVGMDASKRNMVRYGGSSSVRDLYDFNPPAGGGQGIVSNWQTANPMTSGELCYMLSRGTNGEVWRQAIGEDAAPLPFSQGPVVYACGQLHCDGTAVTGSTYYSNTDEGLTTIGHDYEHAFCTVCGAQEPGVEIGPRKVFIMAGQSNADGRPAITTMPDYIQRLVTDGGSRLCYWTYANGTDAAWSMFGGKFQPYMPYTDNNATSRCGFDGIVYHLIEEELRQRFYIIKESRGGTAIDTRCTSTGNLWWCADPDWLATAAPRSGHSLALELTENIGLCVDQVLSAINEGYDIQCIMWHQGESDRTQAASYESNLRQLVCYLRQYLVAKTGCQNYATLPFIAGTVNRKSTQYNANVEAALLRLAASDPDFHVVDMSDCKLGSDNLHFDAEGCVDAATRMFRKLKELHLLDDDTDILRQPSSTIPSPLFYRLDGCPSTASGHGLFLTQGRKVLKAK